MFEITWKLTLKVTIHAAILVTFRLKKIKNVLFLKTEYFLKSLNKSGSSSCSIANGSNSSLGAVLAFLLLLTGFESQILNNFP